MSQPLTHDSDRSTATFHRRILIAVLFILLGLSGLALRYGYLQIAQYDKYRTNAENNRIKLISDPPSRGYIYDRNGILLADNTPVFTAVISPDEIENPEHTLKLLVPIFGLTTRLPTFWLVLTNPKTTLLPLRLT